MIQTLRNRKNKPQKEKTEDRREKKNRDECSNEGQRKSEDGWFNSINMKNVDDGRTLSKAGMFGKFLP